MNSRVITIYHGLWLSISADSEKAFVYNEYNTCNDPNGISMAAYYCRLLRAQKTADIVLEIA